MRIYASILAIGGLAAVFVGALLEVEWLVVVTAPAFSVGLGILIGLEHHSRRE